MFVQRAYDVPYNSFVFPLQENTIYASAYRKILMMVKNIHWVVKKLNISRGDSFVHTSKKKSYGVGSIFNPPKNDRVF